MKRGLAVIAATCVAGCSDSGRQVAAPAPVAASAAVAPAPVAVPVRQAASTVTRVVVSAGRPSGHSIATTQPDGTMSVVLQVLINGRGPKFDATIHLAPDGTLSSFSASGHYEMGTRLEERFTREGRRARWKSEEEQGEREIDGSAFFLPIADLPDARGLLAGALLKAGGRLALLPDGEARLDKIGEATVSDANGQTRRVVGYAITGVEMTPLPVWMNEDGTWFGNVKPSFSVIPKGWERAIEPLLAKQGEYSRARDAKLAAKYGHRPPPSGLAYTHARVLDVERGRWLEDHTVVVVGDRISAVGPSGKVSVPAAAEVVDLAGKALLPGLWDMHEHLGDASGVLTIASGVTTVRDLGTSLEKLDDFKQRYDEGAAIGPHVFRFGLIEGRNERAWTSDVTAETADEARAGVAEYARRGYEGIKIYTSIRPELVPVIVQEAHRRKMLVTGHVPVHMLAHEVVHAGFDGFEHINMLFLNFFATKETETRDTTRFTLVGDNAANLDLESKAVRDFVALLKKKGTVFTPTLTAFEDLYVGEPGKVIPGLERLAARMPVQNQRSFLKNGLPDRGKAALYRSSYDKMLAIVKLFVDRGVTVTVGTDWTSGVFVQHELALFVRAGIPAAKALAMATIVPARTLKVADKMGSIAVGKVADLVVVDGDPLARIAEVANVVSTMRAGVVFPSAQLYESVGMKPVALPSAPRSGG